VYSAIIAIFTAKLIANAKADKHTIFLMLKLM